MAEAAGEPQSKPYLKNLVGLIRAISGKQPTAFLAIFTAITATFAYTSPFFSEIERWTIIAPMVGGLILARTIVGHGLFAIAAGMLVWTLWLDWYLTANHGFIITYFGAFLAIVWVTRDDFWELGVSFSRSILMVLMGFAFLHKVTSGYYMSGNQFADLLLDGESYLFLIGLLDPGALENVSNITRTASQFSGDYSAQMSGASVPLPELSLLLVIMVYGMTYASVVLQGGLELAIILNERFGIWVHRLLFLFTLTVYTLRPENVFLSLNLMMGYALTNDDARAMRLPYVALIAYFLISALVGYRPIWLH